LREPRVPQILTVEPNHGLKVQGSLLEALDEGG